MKTKICNTCKIELPLTDFYKKPSKDGLSTQCKSCRRNKTREHDALNKEIMSAKRKVYYKINRKSLLENKKLYGNLNKIILNKKHKQYYKDNSTKYIEKAKQYYKLNLANCKLNHKKWRETNKVKVANNQKQWKINNRGKCNTYNQTRKSKKLNLLSTLTDLQWKTIKQDFNNRCAYCNKELPLAQEHFIALTKGGEFTTNNIIPACLSCNSSKGSKDFNEWYPTFKYYSKKREQIILKYLNYKDSVQQLKII